MCAALRLKGLQYTIHKLYRGALLHTVMGRENFCRKKKTTNHFSVQGKRVKGNTFAMNGVSVCRVSGRGVFFYPIES